MKVADKDLTPQGQIRQVMHGVADRTETGLTKKDILVEKVKQPDGSVKLLYKRKGKAKAAKDRYNSKSTPSSFKAWSDITQQVWKEMGTPEMKRVNDVVKKGTPTYREIKRRHEEWKKKNGAGGTRQNAGEKGSKPRYRATNTAQSSFGKHLQQALSGSKPQTNDCDTDCHHCQKDIDSFNKNLSKFSNPHQAFKKTSVNCKDCVTRCSVLGSNHRPTGK